MAKREVKHPHPLAAIECFKAYHEAVTVLCMAAHNLLNFSGPDRDDAKILQAGAEPLQKALDRVQALYRVHGEDA